MLSRVLCPTSSVVRGWAYADGSRLIVKLKELFLFPHKNIMAPYQVKRAYDRVIDIKYILDGMVGKIDCANSVDNIHALFCHRLDYTPCVQLKRVTFHLLPSDSVDDIHVLLCHRLDRTTLRATETRNVSSSSLRLC
ncbi:hypothetical protein VNO77_39094 [Canavalia gladiata]|uniref:Uncharacterized protein n=1 Tax=Canavalia gladiata TaxID=3824 RepID=A0AAN9KAF5_CANGL